TIDDRLRDGPEIDEFQFAAQRNAASDTADSDAAGAEHLCHVVRGRLSFIREIGREDDLLNDAICGSRKQTIEADVTRTDAIERRQASHQYEIHSRVTERLLNG